MIRVLHVVNSITVSSGVSAFLMNIYREIDKNEIQFDFVTPDVNFNNSYYQEIISLGGKVFIYPIIKAKNWYKVRAWWKNFLYANRNNYEIVHLHYFKGLPVFADIIHANKCRIIIHAHTIVSKSLYLYYFKLAGRVASIFADELWGCSLYAGTLNFGRKAVRNRFVFIPNGINVNRFKFDTHQRKMIRSQLKISDKTFVVGYVARVVEDKNQEFAIDVFQKLMIRIPDSLLIFVGDDSSEYANRLKMVVNQYGLSPKIIFTGTKSNIEDYLQAFDYFIFPSRAEAFGISLLEAQCEGLPCIISKVVQKEVDLHVGLLNWMSGFNSVEWSNKIYDTRQVERHDCSNIVCEKKYDIRSTSNFIMKEYKRILQANNVYPKSKL